ncbi:diphthine synthase [Candidatus Methanocrinis natronophilus]|uniref:Diphthine synthase n=1 Tax=Candidatus Methanocrinis natronophilus TaxID=3033396 RepID=A0ABT5X7R6_9EURY|nr:diphthine synthase [Candidatus Methanocrinis natronophilus]MDF0590746.1 diphthine synthase [Candidatus Methanocrinis natronophilus]
MLSFVGLGLYDEMDVSVKGLAAIREADLVFAEFYTSHLAGATPERLAEFYGKGVRILSREEVEVSPEGWIGEAREKKVAFLVGGDPMISTTHLDLRLRALRMGIVTRIIHSSSIVTAVSGLTGLQNYRFGRSTSIPYPYVASGKRIVATSPYDVVIDNLHRELHTLLFLDIQPDRYMTVSEGAALLLEMEEMAGEDRLKRGLGVGVARAGSDDAVIIADWLPRLADRDLGGPLHVLIVPASLHFMEAEGLVTLAAAPPEILDEAEP